MDYIYESFNEIDIDLEELEELEMNDLEIKRIKKKVHQKIDKSTLTKRIFKRTGMAAAFFIALLISYVFVGKPILAQNEILIDGIIERLSYGADYKKIAEYSTVVDQTVTDKNISITITEVVLDDNRMKIAYKIYAPELDLKAKGFGSSVFLGLNVKINGKGFMTGASGNMNYIDDHTIEAVKNLNIVNKKLPGSMRMDIYFNELYGVKGNWSFNFRVSKENIQKHTENVKINKTLEFDGFHLKLNKLSYSPLTTVLTFDLKGDVPTIFGFIMLDQNGKEIPGDGGEHGTNNGKGDGNEYHYSITDMNISKITLIPWIAWDGAKSNRQNPVELMDKVPIVLQQNDKSRIIINSVKFEKDIVILDYMVEGCISPLIQSRAFILQDDNGKELMEYSDTENFSQNAMEERYLKNESFTRAFKLNGSKKYYLIFSDMKGTTIYEDKKVEINLK